MNDPGLTEETLPPNDLIRPAALLPASVQGVAAEQQEHNSEVLRMRRVVTIGLVFWWLFGILDWVVVRYIEPGRLSTYLLLRAVAFLPLLAVVGRMYLKPIPSPRLFALLDLTFFTVPSICVSLMCLEFRGIGSPYAAGITVVLVCRSSVVIGEPWRRGLLHVGLPAVAHPITLLIAAAFSPRLAAQFGDPATSAMFVHNLFFIFANSVLLVFGGHGVWLLRRSIFEARNIGRYRLERRIGMGGMGEVWVAYHSALRRKVAVKILRPDLQSAGNEVRFEREVRALTELSSPNTVRVFDYGVTEDGLRYFAMELLEGVDAATLVARHGPVEPARAVHLILQAARALSEAHARGIVHRDIKPDNLFVLSSEGVHDFVKVLDFGIAKVTGGDLSATVTHGGWVGGTPAYMSPEVASGRQADARSDVYGLGAVLYFLLCGRPPFEGSSAAALLAAHLSEQPRLPSARLGRPLPAAVERVVMRCLEKAPEDRYPSARELAAALQERVGAA